MGGKKTQKYLLGALEQLVAANEEQLLAKVPHVFKALYDLDIVDEEAFASWGEKVSKKYTKSKEMSQRIHDKAAPFIKWLAEADEESSEEEDEEEDENAVEFDAEAAEEAAKEAAAAAEAAAAEESEEDDDVDIDNI